MQATDHINITLILKNRNAVDLRIPVLISAGALVRQLQSIFHLDEKEGMKQIKVHTKGLILTENQLLHEHPMADGDIIEII